MMTHSIESFVYVLLAFTSNEETFLQDFLEIRIASEFLENHEEMFPRYYMHSSIYTTYKYLTT